MVLVCYWYGVRPVVYVDSITHTLLYTHRVLQGGVQYRYQRHLITKLQQIRVRCREAHTLVLLHFPLFKPSNSMWVVVFLGGGGVHVL